MKQAVGVGLAVVFLVIGYQLGNHLVIRFMTTPAAPAPAPVAAQ